ncbi:MAG: phosphatidylserine/phosphatidylglycerophosphate/cardiolipin synthase family protein [Candidatus Moraniibacteriota bacterium]
MRYQLFTTSVKAWDGMLRAIRDARQSIYLEMYIFHPNTTGGEHDFLSALETKVLDGVRVVLVLDAFGSKEFRLSPHAKRLEQAGVEIIFYSHWFRHIHRKLLVIDETVAFIGGVNIGQKYASWNDLQVRLKGKLLVNRILASFAVTYAIAGGQDTDILAFQKRPLERKLKWWLVEHWPAHNIHSLRKHYVEKIGQAQKSIRIITPYFTPPRWLISLLDNAIRRGVQVEIIIPQKSDFINRINYRYAYTLNAIGVQFFLAKKMNHSKLLLIDDAIGLIGSQNLDFLSFQLNSEIGVFFEDKKLIHELEVLWERWKKQSVPFSPSHYRMKLIDYFILVGMKILHPIL